MEQLKHILTFFLAWWCSLTFSQTVYPIPHHVQKLEGTCAFTKNVTIIATDAIDDETRQRACEILKEHGLNPVFATSPSKHSATIRLALLPQHNLGKEKGLEALVSLLPANKFDRHIFRLHRDRRGNASLTILGEHTTAVFCALATLEQLLDEGVTALPCVDIADYADLRERGIVEGYYGMPYSTAVTRDLLRFMKRYKMNAYLYGAKSDAYHSQYWDRPYPDTLTAKQQQMGCFTAQDLREVCREAKASKVHFIWAIHPGQAFVGEDDGVIGRIMQKFRLMHKLGVRRFGVFVDDVGVPSDDATMHLNAHRLSLLQAQIDSTWNQPSNADSVGGLVFVPQLYAYGWVKEPHYSRFYRALSERPAKVQVLITGQAVWSVPNNEDISVVRRYLKGDMGWWWNYPCNDNADAWIFPASMEDNFKDMPEIADTARMPLQLKDCSALLCNPMQEGEISKIALFSAADYAWNNSAFHNDSSWLAALPAVVGKEYAPVLRRLIPYLRINDPDSLATLIAEYKQTGSSTRLSALFSKIQADCARLSELQTSPIESHRLFWQDIMPWVEKLKEITLPVAPPQPSPMGEGAPKANKEVEKTPSPFGASVPRGKGSRRGCGWGEATPRFSIEVLEGMGGEIVKKRYTVELSLRHLTPFKE